MKNVRVGVCDQHSIFRLGLVALLRREPGIELIGVELSSPEEAIGLAGELSGADVVLVGLGGPDGFTISSVSEMLAAGAETRFLVLGLLDDDGSPERALRAGAHGYLSKLEAAERLVEAIRQIAEGEVVVPASAAAALAGTADARSLSAREREVFKLVGRGRTTQESAKELSISVKTVESHHANIKRKLGLRNVNELVREAVLWSDERRIA